jgi:uncharacterized DUF497 family protein
VIFEWDAGEAVANRKKHRVTFENATTVFFDPLAITLTTPITMRKKTGRSRSDILEEEN